MADQLPRVTLTRPWLVSCDDDPAVTVTLATGDMIAPRYLRSLRRWAIDVDGVRYSSSRKPTCEPPVTRETHAVKSGPSGKGDPVLSVRLPPDVRDSLVELAAERGLPLSRFVGELLTTVVQGVQARRKR